MSYSTSDTSGNNDTVTLQSFSLKLPYTGANL